MSSDFETDTTQREARPMADARANMTEIVMPNDAPQVKKDAVAGYGAEIIWCEPTLEARESTLAEVLEKTGAEPVHPYEDPRVINGQGTVGLEIAFQMGGTPPDVVLTPVGEALLTIGVARR